jgi:hypothetical protein
MIAEDRPESRGLREFGVFLGFRRRRTFTLGVPAAYSPEFHPI